MIQSLQQILEVEEKLPKYLMSGFGQSSEADMLAGLHARQSMCVPISHWA